MLEKADTKGLSLVQKADAALDEGLRNRSTRDSKQTQIDASPAPIDPESTLNLLLQRDPDFADTLMRLLVQRPGQLDQVASQFAKMGQLADRNDLPPFDFLKLDSPVSAGNAAQVVFALINGSGDKTANCTLHSTDLVGMDGHRIPASHIKISPDALSVRPGESQDGQIQVRVPSGTPPGTYAGLLRTEDMGRLLAVFQLAVTP